MELEEVQASVRAADDQNLVAVYDLSVKGLGVRGKHQALEAMELFVVEDVHSSPQSNQHNQILIHAAGHFGHFEETLRKADSSQNFKGLVNLLEVYLLAFVQEINLL